LPSSRPARGVFLGQQAERTSQAEQALENLLGFRLAPGERQIVGEPQGAGQEHALTAGQPIGSRRIAAREPLDRQLPADRLDRADHAPEIRRTIIENMEWLGLILDVGANEVGGPRVSTPESRASAWLIPTDEDVMIAWRVWRLTENRRTKEPQTPLRGRRLA